MDLNIGVDLHKTQFTVYFKSIDRFREYATTETGYRSFIADIARIKDVDGRVRIGIESTGNTRFFKNYMERHSIEVTVINTMKFKVINESVKKTDKHDACTIADFLEKDMLPESRICSEYSEEIRRLLKVRTTLVRASVTVKNQIHGLLVGQGIEDKKATLQSKRGRQKVLSTLAKMANGLAVQPLFDILDNLAEQVKKIEKELEKITAGDEAIELLLTIPGCGPITAWTIRAYTDDIKDFKESKKYSSYAGLTPWVQCSNTTERYGKITKRGPEELRTALVQLVMGMNRTKSIADYRIMLQYKNMKKYKGSGKSIIATARKLSKIIWHMLTYSKPFNPCLMYDNDLNKIANDMRILSIKSA